MVARRKKRQMDSNNLNYYAFNIFVAPFWYDFFLWNIFSSAILSSSTAVYHNRVGVVFHKPRRYSALLAHNNLFHTFYSWVRKKGTVVQTFNLSFHSFDGVSLHNIPANAVWSPIQILKFRNRTRSSMCARYNPRGILIKLYSQSFIDKDIGVLCFMVGLPSSFNLNPLLAIY